MNLLTLGVARQTLWDASSSLAYDESNTSEVVKVNATINRASEVFFRGGGNWRGTLDRVAITAYGGIITLPRGLQTVLGVKSNLGNKLLIHPIWYEFLGGSCSLNGYNGSNDLGEGFCTFADMPAPAQLAIVSVEGGASTAVLTVSGIDDSGVPFTTAVALNVATTIVPTLTARITKLHKPATTGYVKIYYIDGLNTILMAALEPGETDANYRRYRVSTTTETVDAICKRTFIPAVADLDQVVPGFTEAIRTMIQALIYKDRNDRERFIEYRDDAIAMADADRQQFDGDSQTPIFQVIPGFGVQSIPRLPRRGYYGDFVPGHYPDSCGCATAPVNTPIPILDLLQAISPLLPTSDPHILGRWWNNGTEVVISNG